MKQLHNLVNIVPVIGKADTLTAAELKKFKIKVHTVHVFAFIFPFNVLCVFPNSIKVDTVDAFVFELTLLVCKWLK